nr:MAG TPA: hypothetical protein [Caudoviricetes sp.]
MQVQNQNCVYAISYKIRIKSGMIHNLLILLFHNLVNYEMV